MSRFAAAVASAATRTPMANGAVPMTQDRVLNIDGDMLAYYCAGNDDVDTGIARSSLMGKIEAGMRAAKAQTARIVLTSEASHKGYRYAVASVKPYQQQRAGKVKPRNWRFLRDFMTEGRLPHELIVTDIAEADDELARLARLPGPTPILMSNDKDLRMVPGWHLTWTDHILINVNSFLVDSRDKEYGEYWFWKQMITGDPVDTIPGLPGQYYTNAKGERKVRKLGEVGAGLILQGVRSTEAAVKVVREAYENWYGDEALVHMLEQASLLWMRIDPSDPFDCLSEGRPLHTLAREMSGAITQIQSRINYAKSCEASANADSSGQDSDAGTAEHALRAVQPAAGEGQGCSGPLPLDGVCESSPALVVQCVTRQTGKRDEALRSDQLFRIPAWCRLLYPAACRTTNQPAASAVPG